MTGRVPLRTAAAGITIAVLAVLVLAVDQFAKFLAVAHLPPEQPVHVLGDFLILYLVRNSGAAFSLGEGITWVFTLALIAVAIAIVWITLTRVRSRAWAIILGLLLGGVLGNLSDRLFRPPGFGVGHVVDFINTPWMMPAIYNVADMFIVTMMIGVAILVFTGLRFDGSRERRAPVVDDAVADVEADVEPLAEGMAPVAESEAAGVAGETPAPGEPAKD